MINKGLSTEDLLTAAIALVKAGIYTLKLYVMIGLPTETEHDLAELVQLVCTIREKILPIGREKGRVCEIILSVNSFVPKPWTPFQYLAFGGMDGEYQSEPDRKEQEKLTNTAVAGLKKKIRYLKVNLAKVANLHIRVDRPERVLVQAVFSRADRRIAPVLLGMARGASFKQAMRAAGLTAWQYAIRPRAADELFCWQVVDHGIEDGYLFRELEKGLAEKSTLACDTARCRRCGVCRD